MSQSAAASQARYEPGSWVVCAGSDLWLLAGIDPGAPVVGLCWAEIDSGGGIDSVLAVMVREGLRSVQGFALLGPTTDGMRRLLLSGPIHASAEHPDGSAEQLVPQPPQVWTEHAVATADVVRLIVDEAGESAVRLPLHTGVALAHVVEVRPVTSDAASSVPPAAPTGATPPVPPGQPEVAAAAEPAPAASASSPAAEPEVAAPGSESDQPQPPTDTGGFDFLFGATQPPSPESEQHQPPVALDKPAANGVPRNADTVVGQNPVPGPDSAPARPEPSHPAPAQPTAPPPTPAAPQDTVAPPVQPAAAPLVPAVEGGPGLIDALPWQLPENVAPPQTPAPSQPAPSQPAPSQPAPSQPAPSQPVQPDPAAAYAQNPYDQQPAYAQPAQPAYDHRAYDQSAYGQPTAAPDAVADSGPSVLAVVCPYGHLSESYASACRVCGTPVPAQEPFTTPRPVLGTLALSTGDLVTLDRDVIMGRSPARSRGDGRTRPHIVQVASPANDISRTHLEVRLDGWHVLVTDLGSTNGTVVTLPNQPPVRLRANDPLAIVPGTTVSMADEVSFRYDVPQ